jgi:NAD(P)-dependent dehydrogenase (short-subunit alcohol dehydrogenase family)
LNEELEGKVALITGTASGIGKSICELFSGEGARVFEIDIGFKESSIMKSSALRSQFQADLTSPKQVQDAIKSLEEKYDRLDIVVNCAGIEMPGNVIDLSEESYDRVMDTNVKTIFLVCKYAIPLILKSTSRGSIINLSSDLGIQPIPNTDAYAASKGAIISLTKALSKNWAKQGLRVNCIAPGPIDTPLLHRFQNEATLDFVKNTMIPAGRIGKPSEVANVALFLASDKSSFVNGAILTVNGGLLG